MNKERIYPFLEDLQNRIDVTQEENLWCEWRKYADGKVEGDTFSPPNRKPAPPKIEWENISINRGIADHDDMILQQFKLCSDVIEKGSNRIMQIRPNYGVGILPSLYGVELFMMDEKANTLPNVYPLKNGLDDIQKLVQNPMPDLNGGFGKDVFMFAEDILEIFQDFPILSKYIFLEHPDCQGPMDVCELLWGSEIFADLYDEPELVHDTLVKISDTYEAFMSKWFKLINREMGYHSYGFKLHKGNIVVRDDSAMNMSGEFYMEFIRPYNQRVLNTFDGGGIHFCGRGQHFIEPMSKIDNLFAVDMSQPHLNDMETILSNTVDKGINLFLPKYDFDQTVLDKKHDLRYMYQG